MVILHVSMEIQPIPLVPASKDHCEKPFEHPISKLGVSIKEVGVSVEWIFGDIINYFKDLDLKKDLKIGLSSVSKMYIVCALLYKARTILYGNTTSQYFDIKRPMLGDYFI